MTCYRFFVAITVLVFFSCNDNDGQLDTTAPEITITGFKTTKDRVELSWVINKGSDVIIDDLFVIRKAEDQEYPLSFQDVKTNMPSTSTVFVDVDIPYWNDLTYQVMLNYREKEGDKDAVVMIESEKSVFSRTFPRFDRVPFQVSKDPSDPNIFHILEWRGEASLNRYSFDEDLITNRFVIEENYYDFYNRFVFHEDALLASNLTGNVYVLAPNNYTIIGHYDTQVSEKLGSVGIIENRLFFLDDDLWFDYLDLSTGDVVKHGLGPGFRNFQVIDGNKLLHLYNGTHDSGAAIYEFGPDLDPEYGWDFSLNKTMDTSGVDFDGDDVDQFNVAFDTENTSFVSGIDGHIFDLNNLSLKTVLNDQTGKKYFGYAFDHQGNLYAAVQKEKSIHVFDNETLELKEVIATKLFPLFPMVTGSGLKCIGSYEPFEYWGYDYGYSHSFNSKCAIENFE